METELRKPPRLYSTRPVNNSDDGFWKVSNKAKIGIGIAAIALGITAAVLSGGTAVPALITALQISGSSTAMGAGMGAIFSGISTLVSGGNIRNVGSSMLRGAVDGAVDGAADGFMWGGVGVLASKAGYGWKVSKNLQVLYKTPSTKGGALFASRKPKVRVEGDMLHGLHGHWGVGKKAQSIHRSLNSFKWGAEKKGFWR
jgi:hypothetical protein